MLTHKKNMPLRAKFRGYRATFEGSDVKLPILRVGRNHEPIRTVLDDVRFSPFWVEFWMRVRKRN